MGKWVEHLAVNNIIKHRKRNIFSIISLVVGLSSSFLIIGFSYGAEDSIKKECYKQYDYGSLTITKESKSESSNGGLSIIRNTRPSIEELWNINEIKSNYEIDYNLQSLVPSFSTVLFERNELKDFTYEPIYSFNGNYVNKELLIEGDYPPYEYLDHVLINEKANNVFKKTYKTSLVGKLLKIKYEIDHPYYPKDGSPVINDYFIYNQEVRVVGVVKDLSFLATPKIYYSHVALKDYLSTIYLNNLSDYLERDYSWLDRINDCSGSDEISSYSYRLFLKDSNKVDTISTFISNISEPYSVTSSSQTRTDALLGLINAATTGMELFLIIALVGTALIMGIVSFSFYSEDRKVIAILSCLGAKTDDINDIYCLENIMVGLIAFAISIIISPILQMAINSIVYKVAGFSNIVNIPLKTFINIPFGLPIIVFIGTVIVCVFSTLLPIMFSRKISLKEELKDE